MRSLSKLNKRGEILALKRSRVVAGAMQKLEALKREITPYKDDNNILVYCGATRVLDDALDEYHKKLPIFYFENGNSMQDDKLDQLIYGYSVS